MNDTQNGRTDPWQRALGSARRPERVKRRPQPGPGRHRPAVARTDPWERALTGPPLDQGATAGTVADEGRASRVSARTA